MRSLELRSRNIMQRSIEESRRKMEESFASALAGETEVLEVMLHESRIVADDPLPELFGAPTSIHRVHLNSLALPQQARLQSRRGQSTTAPSTSTFAEAASRPILPARGELDVTTTAWPARPALVASPSLSKVDLGVAAAGVSRSPSPIRVTGLAGGAEITEPLTTHSPASSRRSARPLHVYKIGQALGRRSISPRKAALARPIAASDNYARCCVSMKVGEMEDESYDLVSSLRFNVELTDISSVARYSRRYLNVSVDKDRLLVFTASPPARPARGVEHAATIISPLHDFHWVTSLEELRGRCMAVRIHVTAPFTAEISRSSLFFTKQTATSPPIAISPSHEYISNTPAIGSIEVDDAKNAECLEGKCTWPDALPRPRVTIVAGADVEISQVWRLDHAIASSAFGKAASTDKRTTRPAKPDHESSKEVFTQADILAAKRHELHVLRQAMLERSRTAAAEAYSDIKRHHSSLAVRALERGSAARSPRPSTAGVVDTPTTMDRVESRHRPKTSVQVATPVISILEASPVEEYSLWPTWGSEPSPIDTDYWSAMQAMPKTS